MTMAACYMGPEFMEELEAAGGDFTTLSNTVAARDGARPTRYLLADLAPGCCTSGNRPVGGRGAADPLRDP